MELAFEPEVAALHCRAIPSENLSGSTKELEEMFKPGIKFAVLDLGGNIDFFFPCLLTCKVAQDILFFSIKLLGFFFSDIAVHMININLV